MTVETGLILFGLTALAAAAAGWVAYFDAAVESRRREAMLREQLTLYRMDAAAAHREADRVLMRAGNTATVLEIVADRPSVSEAVSRDLRDIAKGLR